MSKTLRVLIVEDSEDDALLLARALRRAGYDVSFERVETAGTMTEALARQTWNLIIADHSMPHFSGTEALELLKKSGLDIPFIFVSGTIGEDTAVAAMKAGAQDYIMKGHLTRLIPAIERELREAEVRIQRRRAEQQVQLHRRRQAVLYDINLAMTSTLDLKKVLDLLLEKNDLLLPYSATTVSLINKADGKLEPVAYHNVDEEKWKAQELEHGLTNVVFEIKSPLVVGNLQTHPGLQDRDFYLDQGFVSYLGVPLIIRGEVLGVLSFYTKGEHLFANEEVEFLSTLAGQAAIAIHNSQLYEQTKQQALDLEKANKVKDEFLSVMSHEMRTPLTVVLGNARMILDRVLGEIAAGHEEALGKIISSSNNLLNMVNGILEATRIEAQTVKLESRLVRLSNFLDELRSDYNFPLDKELTLTWDYPSELPSMRTDKDKLKQILQNLINNAIKFTERGNVTIAARHSPEVKTVEFKVADTGIGIPEESLPFIFQIFRQLDSSNKRSYGGVGLGLYIVKRYTDLLRGTVKVESEPGKGLTFTVTIPSEK